ncbi:DUF917 family protein [Roseococcus sp.]|uniref:S-methyl thiohydantoin desulfurase domain-containing protein n=1 Tax=Roseococcus sp. TaxID=2109646 RepID=UPI003BAD7DC2
MPVKMDLEALEGAILGGLVLSAGGSGMKRAERNRRIGEQALDYGPLSMVTLDELSDDAGIIVATGVGAPGYAKAITSMRDSVKSAEMLIAATGGKLPAGVMPGHVPGLMAWMQAAVLGIPLVDAATNGRGHPTVKMGGMGLASMPHVQVTQAGCGGAPDDRVEIVVTGNMSKTSTIMRAASVQNGGSIYATRGPFAASFVRKGGAPGAMSFATGLGRAMLDKPASFARVEAAAAFLSGEVLVTGRVELNDVHYEGGFDVGRVVIKGDGGTITLHIYNEYMAADRDGVRVRTFPDMMGSFDPATGAPIAINEMPVGRDVAIVSGPNTAYPVGAGARDPAVFPEVEEKLGVKLSP